MGGRNRVVNGFSYYNYIRINSIKDICGKLIVNFECAKHRRKSHPDEHVIVGVYELSIIIDKNDKNIIYNHKPMKNVLIDRNAYLNPPDVYDFDKHEVHRMDYYSFCIIEKATKIKNKIEVGCDENVFIYLKNGYMISSLSEGELLVWDLKTMSIKDLISLQYPFFPIRGIGMGKGGGYRKISKISDDDELYSIDECKLNLNTILGKIDDFKKREMFSSMISEYKNFFIGKNDRFLPIGWLERKKKLYVHYKEYLVIIDVNFESLMNIIKISRKNDLIRDCTLRNCMSSINTIYRIYSNDYRLVILYSNCYVNYMAEVINLQNKSIISKMMPICRKLNDACFISDNILAVGTSENNRAIILYNVDTGKEIKRLYHITNVKIKGCRFKGTMCDDETLEIIRQQGGKIIE